MSQRYIRKPGYLAVETETIVDDGYNAALVTRLDDTGVEHTVKIVGYQDLEDIEDRLVPLDFPYVPPAYNKP